MKRLIMLALVAVPAFAFTVNFIYNYHDNYDPAGYWEDEYWNDYYWSDGHWLYYPHGYYCVHYVWWYPWWWDWYWYRCRWVRHFHWDFFYAGFYVVWYEHGGWWYRPRYGRWVRNRLPYTYHELRHKARQRGFNLPDKPPREINIPYQEKEVIRLSREQDPETFRRIEQEHQSGNLERMRVDHVEKVKKEINVKNVEYRIDAIKSDGDRKAQDRNVMPDQFDNRPGDKSIYNKHLDDERNDKSDDRGPGIIKREKDRFDDDRSVPRRDPGAPGQQIAPEEKQDKDSKRLMPPSREKQSMPMPQDRLERERVPDRVPSKKDEEVSR